MSSIRSGVEYFLLDFYSAKGDGVCKQPSTIYDFAVVVVCFFLAFSVLVVDSNKRST